MKTRNVLFSVLLVMCIVPFGMGQTIIGSAHDFSSAVWNTGSGGQICVVCHTPHNANTSVSDAPLWNHQLTTATFTLYTSSTLTATMGQPDGNTKLCLSCHDGTVALENFGGKTNGTNHMATNSPGYIGTTLNNDHPVSFTYDATLSGSDPGLRNPATTISGLGSTIAANMLFSGKMQCASCHDVHNTPGIAGLLVKSNNASALCLTCHIK